MNLNYNGNTIRIDDETFDLNGESTLLSLRNGGGKTVLVQMVTSLFVHKTYRDFGDRSFQNYFTTKKVLTITVNTFKYYLLLIFLYSQHLHSELPKSTIRYIDVIL